MHLQCANIWQKVHIEIWYVLKCKHWSTLGHWASIHWKKAMFMSLFVPSYNGYTPDMVLSVGQNFNVVNILPSSIWKIIRVAKKPDQWQMFLDKSCLICLSGWFHSTKVPLHSTVFVINKGPVCEFNCPKHPELRHQSCHSPPCPTVCCRSWSLYRLEESTLTLYDSVSKGQAGAA